MMDFGGETSCSRSLDDYIIGPKIGSGSFAEVWRSKHRRSGTEFAIKEIDKKHLNNYLLKEISILRNIIHPNIIRLFQVIETDERIFLVFEYCDGGDLGQYIHRHGKVSEEVARHFMKQLAAGLRVLHENRLIHRDLKPQNLLLSGKEVSPLLKIGDFGFARYLTQGLADTLCGTPLYMAPEIFQNLKYDGKADLWSVGAILYQLVIGKPPFTGNNQLQLFENILTSTELQFPKAALEVLHPDCVELCKSLLRRNPVERLSFEEFFNHRFLTGPRDAVDSSSQISQVESSVLSDDQRSQLHQENKFKAHDESVKRDLSAVNDEKTQLGKDRCSTSSGKDVHGVMSNTYGDKIRQSVEVRPHSSSQIQGSDSLNSIARDYVLVHSNFASMEILTTTLGTSLKESSTAKACASAPKNIEQQMPVMPEIMVMADKFIGSAETSQSGMDPSTACGAPCTVREVQVLPIHLPKRLRLLHQYIDALSDLAGEKFNAGLYLESFSVELVALALWKEALRICSSGLLSEGENELPEVNESACKGAACSSLKAEDAAGFKIPSSASVWVEQGFIVACDRTEKVSKYLQDINGATEMPDALEIIYQEALAAGRSGAGDQLIGHRDSAAIMYSKALLLLSFIIAEAPSLPLKPAFSLAPDIKQRILGYIKSLETHLSQSHSLTSQPSLRQLPDFVTK